MYNKADSAFQFPAVYWLLLQPFYQSFYLLEIFLNQQIV